VHTRRSIRGRKALLGPVVVLALSLIVPLSAFAQTPDASGAAITQPQQAAPSVAPASGDSSVPARAAQDGRPSDVPNPDVVFKLPRDLSPWGMFMAADIVVKAVMIGLAFASVFIWTIWLAKVIELIMARRSLRAALAALEQARSWNEAAAVWQGRRDAAAAAVAAADNELKLSAGALADVKERIGSRLEHIEAAAGRQIVRGTGILATVGATAPFVGLFGTVWGIMNSFIGISKQHTTNLAVVAPGIAEALLATALGLVAAIPAVVMYNMFARWVGGYRALHADVTAEILRLISRDLDRGAISDRLHRHRTAAE